ncbi:NADPH:quinone reductase-like Zn-dependent oxidoreductase [Actinoplanes octamycinicus]|uniref:NADPH:quinone reductase-like Zn-dependent oxidoreductase n=1 Tax=Actinoplanes octamycinicus TaxID=135948 RepID=A0A7W7M9G1_9ACTN|nr:NADP-dependent oxidoreductase [Actinoplanes octamycinicus]MBB4741826.1 NADPH:quinone reductase-like Zn-dependent oxidoreductase [Actinoplanes octamycinicus]
MRAVIINSYGGPEVLRVAETPLPEPGPGQVRIRVAAAAVNPVDLQTRSGALAGLLPPRETIGIGWDLSGTVDAVGPRVTGFLVGERVVALSDRLALPAKAQADFAVLDAEAVGKLPPDVDLVAAATLPLNALTAAQALDLAGLRPGQTLLVTGAAGGVGGFAVELAARSGLRVVATADEQDELFVREAGASEVVPRGRELADVVRKRVPEGVDGVIDAASLGVAALDAVRGGGVHVAVLGGAPVPLRGTRVVNVWIRADGPRLTALAAAGLRLRVAETMPLSRVADAHRTLEKGGVRGRLVLTID